ncbi:sensor histidine kinase [Pseudoduganella violaceinigra]|uniref:sensor histidine kinase n=1 Tax=Pseudoduganella violaceinigra TaxID=246602 RepID=UPI0004213EDE|nr:HAMP domain-containing sensor histidine kinase [Pseudoduganella violaceinigra]
MIRRLIRTRLHARSAEEIADLRLAALSWLGITCFPLYYAFFAWIFPQPYESVVARAVGTALAFGGLLARRLPPRQRERYTQLLVTYELPFFCSFMFLMNHANIAWAQVMLVMLVALFHFDARLALRAGAAGIAAAVLLAMALGAGESLRSVAVLQLLPVQLFLVGWMWVFSQSRKALEEEKLDGLGEGLGAVAHEMRTPLASLDANVRGLSRMQQRAGQDNPAMRQALGRMQYEVRHMNHMIDLFLLSAQAVRQKLDPHETVSMLDTVESALRRYPFTGEAQRQLVALQVRSDFRFGGQSELAIMLLLNLLRNAMQAVQRAGKGRVRVVIDGERPTPRVLVIDTGCGIARHHLPLIFQRFFAYPEHNGAGIGLALCRQVMQAWEARLHCVSREHAYAIFVLEFPLEASRQT